MGHPPSRKKMGLKIIIFKYVEFIKDVNYSDMTGLILTGVRNWSLFILS